MTMDLLIASVHLIAIPILPSVTAIIFVIGIGFESISTKMMQN